MTTAPTLRPYQHDAHKAIWGAYQQGMNRILCQKATGLGKTVTFAALLEYAPLKTWLEQFPTRERKMLVIAHREELIDQAADKIHRANPDLQIGIEQGSSVAGPFSDVIVASIQTLAAMKYRRLARLMNYGRMPLVIVDEAHHAAAPTYRNVLVRLGFLPKAEETEDEGDEAGFPDAVTLATALREWETVAPKDRLLIGFTATPNRTDNIGLGCVFQTMPYTYPLRKAVEDKWLSPITPWVIDTSTSLDQVRTVGGEFNQRDLAEAVNTAERNEIAVAAWAQYAKGRQTLAFTVDVAHAKAVAFAFQCRGIRAAFVSGETPKDERRTLLADYTAGRIQLISNCMVLTEGTDLPNTSCILHMKPTKSPTLYEQMTGRGLRQFPGKKDCVVIDVVDITRKHSLQTTAVLYGLPPLKPNGKSLNAMSDEYEALKKDFPQVDFEALILRERPRTLEELRAKFTQFNVWAIPPMGPLARVTRLNWIRAMDGVYRIQYPYPFGDGTEVVKVERNMLSRYDISCTLRLKNGPTTQETIAKDVVDVEEALHLAESFIDTNRGTVVRLKDKNAPWRRTPPSQGQIDQLKRLKIPFSPTLTKGQASDLIDLSNARKGR